MTEPKIVQKSPFVMEVEPGTYAWCRCGLSQKQPYCDGAHKGTGMVPEVITIDEKKTVAWCGCKHTKSPPFCDGTHSRLP